MEVRFSTHHEFDVSVFPYVLHHFAKHCIIHSFEEILLEVVGSFSPTLCVEIDVGFHLCRLIEFNCVMNFL